MNSRLSPLALGFAAAIVSAGVMLLLGVLGNFGVYLSAVDAMMQWHVFFSLSVGGIIAGMIEAAVCGFLIAYAFGWTYNKFVKA